MTSIKQALHKCNNLNDLNNFLMQNNFEAKIGILGGRRIGVSTLRGTVCLNDIKKCYQKVGSEVSYKVKNTIIDKIKDLDEKANLLLSKQSCFIKTLTKIKRCISGKFDFEAFCLPVKPGKEEILQEILESPPKMNFSNPPPDPLFGQPELEPSYALDQRMKAKSPKEQVESFMEYLDQLFYTSNEQFEETKIRYKNFIHAIKSKQKITTKDLRDLDQFLCDAVTAMIHSKAYSTTIRQIISKNPGLDKSKINEARNKNERIAANYRCMSEAINWCYEIADVYGRD